MVVRAVLLHVLACRIQVVTLNAQRRVGLPSVVSKVAVPVRIVADSAQSRRNRHNIQARDREAILQHAQHQVGAGNLQQGRRLRHVRVAVNDVHAAELPKRRRAARRGVNERTSAEVEDAASQMWSARCENEYEGTPVLDAGRSNWHQATIRGVLPAPTRIWRVTRNGTSWAIGR